MKAASQVLQHLERTVAAESETDAQLLQRFTAERDELAFVVLVRRYGSMVLSACRRILHHTEDAEDAFQATFLILARKASSVVKRESLGCWLHRVACRVSVQARVVRSRRLVMERHLQSPPERAVRQEPPCDWLPLLDEEINRLPEKYRSAIVLCDLEGKTRKEAARLLGAPEGTVSGRLTVARRLLAQRLARRGIVPCAGAWLIGLPPAASAHLPSALAMAATRAAAQLAVGQGAVLSTRAGILMTGVLNAMWMQKMKWAAVSGLVAAVLVLGGFASQGKAPRAQAEAPRAAKQEAKPQNEVETLRKEVELLKLNLRVLLEKLQAQELELKALKAKQGKDALWEKLDKQPKRPLGEKLDRQPKGKPDAAPKKEKTGDESAPAGMEGSVRKTDGDLAIIDLGSDAGLKRGHVLEVYRLGPKPKYLGRIKILDVGVARAVGQVVGRLTAPLQEGDRVASRIVGGKKES